MSLPVETVLALLQAHPYLLLFPLVLLEGPIATVAVGLLVAAGLMGWPTAYAVAVAADLVGDSSHEGAKRFFDANTKETLGETVTGAC